MDFRFNTDAKICSGGVLSVCEKVFNPVGQVQDEKKNEDEDEVWDPEDDKDEI